ncbi:type VI secretion system Vgr family protein [Rhizobium halophytocola]|uniref:Type VI secretion system secreted protein VgrG n=1 Tax=Rhizobium halophytocola TaxID=735519 RepID=A0ABS4E3H4_9HYPH|nr:type VI secretion system tip protein TssI/VgrG [Rhizobium halophytocola]MBP1852490.1 type VI secretion system secreted protein VgrG [Rhizobium halophytocola]
MANDSVLEGRQVRLELPNKLKGFLMRAQIEEGLSRITETTIEFMSPDIDLDLEKIVGERLRLEIDAPKDKIRYFQGHCVAAEYLGCHAGRGYFRASVRPWLWFLTRTTNCRIFQDKSVIDVMKEIFSQHGFSDFRDATKRSYPKRTYCVQFHESDFAFISRLMEEEGIYYYHSDEKTKETLILADDASAHKDIEDAKEIDFFFREPDFRRAEDHIFEWRGSESIQTGKVTLQDYDFKKPKSDLKSVKTLPKGKHAYKSYEVYEYPGRHADTREGEHHARVKVEGFAAQAQRSQGVANVRQMAVGSKFKMKKHPRKTENAEYLIISARHQLHIDADIDEREIVEAILGPTLSFDRSNSVDTYRCIFETQPIDAAFRAPQITPRPAMPGVQTAVVVGKAGEEIWTDQYGRVKVQFHWDRVGRRDDTSSCWIRTSVPWSGKGWGMMGVPRIGQEVVVQFEDGDPDRPIITGMVYNGETQVPYGLPGNQTQSGLKTHSSKGGGGFNELVFEDKKGGEFVRLQSERDFTQIIKNNAEVTIGLEHKSGGTFTQTIHGDKTETIREGNHSFTVAKGEEKLSIAKSRDTSIGASDLLVVDADQKVSVKAGKSDDIAKDYKIDVGAALEISAGTRIVLTCGGSKIEMTPAKITISSAQIDIAASAGANLTAGGQLKMEAMGQASLKGAGMLKLEGGGMTQLTSSGMLIAKGALTMIN